MVAVDMRGISKAFPGVQALRDVSLHLRGGEVHALVGENGAGKSTLMKILSGVYTDYEGEILLDNQRVRFEGPRDAEQAGIAIIHQELNLVRELSVAENIYLGREPTTRWGLLDYPVLWTAARKMLEPLNCRVDPRASVAALRIGEQQLVEIAKAMSLNARVLIMDEPTSALSDHEVERLFDVVRGLAARGVAVLYCSHKMDELFRIADRFTVLRDGQWVGERARNEVGPRELIGMMVGRALECEENPVSHATAQPVLEVHALTAPHPDKPGALLLDHVSLTVHRGEIVGLAGLMGAGRTELLEAIFGVLPWPVTGEIRVDGSSMPLGDPRQAIAAGMGLVTEDRKALGLVPEMSVGANITLASLDRFTRGGLVCAGAERDAVSAAVRRLRIKTPGEDTPVVDLSGGNQQKVIVARWLETRPKVLLLDEPTRGIDVGAKGEMYVLMRELAAQGLGMLMASSELPEILRMSDRVLVMREGRLAGEFDRQQASEEAIMQLALAG